MNQFHFSCRQFNEFSLKNQKNQNKKNALLTDLLPPIGSNTTQSVKIDQTNMSKFFLSDYKRRCYGAEDDSESAEMATWTLRTRTLDEIQFNFTLLYVFNRNDASEF